MSDLDDDFMQMSEDEDDFSFEYDDDDDDDHEIQDELMEDVISNKDNGDFSSNDNRNTQNDLDIESLYYTAKATKEENIQRAIQQFNTIIAFDTTQVDQSSLEYIFKSIKQVLKLYYHLGQFDQLMSNLPNLFQILPKLSNKSYGEESINRLISHYDKPKSNNEFLIKFLDRTIQGVIDSYKQDKLPDNRLIPQDRLWLKLNLKKSNLLIRNNQVSDALKLLSSLQEICENSTENIKGSYMLEIIALQIQLYSELPNSFSLLKELYNKSFQINSAVPHPKIMGVINECGGEILMKQSNYTKASNEFYESFKNYDELGDDKRILILKRLMISNMLSESEINPFHSKEFQSFVKLDEIQIFLKLYNSFSNVDIDQFNSLIEQNTNEKGLIFNDSFLTTYIEELKSIIQIKTINKLTKYYTKLELSYLCEILHCDLKTCQTHLLKLISLGKMVNLKIDFVDNIVEIKDFNEEVTRIMPNIDVDDIIDNLRKNSLAEEEQVLDNDGDHSMGDQPIQQQQQQQPSELELPRQRPDYIKLTNEMMSSLNLLLGSISHITTRDSDDHLKDVAIHIVKLQSVLQDWLNILQKSLPIKTADKLSQIEQVKLEQQQQQQQESNINDLNPSHNEVEQETLMGELSLEKFGTDGSNNINNNNLDEKVQVFTKNDSIRYLMKSINSYQDKLMAYYDGKLNFAINMLKRYEEMT